MARIVVTGIRVGIGVIIGVEVIRIGSYPPRAVSIEIGVTPKRKEAKVKVESVPVPVVMETAKAAAEATPKVSEAAISTKVSEAAVPTEVSEAAAVPTEVSEAVFTAEATEASTVKAFAAAKASEATTVTAKSSTMKTAVTAESAAVETAAAAVETATAATTMLGETGFGNDDERDGNCEDTRNSYKGSVHLTSSDITFDALDPSLRIRRWQLGVPAKSSLSPQLEFYT
jgi:hypothetical protein